MRRRDWLKQVGVGAIAAVPATLLAHADSDDKETKASILDGAIAKPDNRIELLVQSDAENGAVVPVGVVSGVPETQRIILLIDKHSRSKVAEIDTSNAMLAPQLSAHLQLTSAATITALIKAPSGWHMNTAEVKTLGESC